VGIGFSSRDGYTKDQHGNTVDDREALFGKGQLIWVPCDRWEVRFILSGERARDGDYALNDLAAVRANPFHVSRTFEGFTHRDLIAPTLLAHYSGERADADIITGLVWWKTEDLTDLDYTALPLITRDNKEKDLQFTEELRVASAKNAPLVLSDNLNLKWQSGIFFFTQNYEQNALNSYAPGLLYQANQFGPGIPPVSSPANSQHAPDSKLDDIGGGVFGQLTLTAWDKLDFSAGVRGDFEHKHGNLKTFFTNPDPFLPNSPTVDAEKDYADASPQFSVAYRFVPDKMVYATVARGFRAGGFNPTAPTNNISYGEEHTWNYEAGFKTSWLDHRLVANFAAFYIDWSNLQFNEANPVSPGSFFIANAGGAVSKGVEAELKYRVLQGWDLFGSVGYTEAKFRSGSTALNPNLAPPFGANQGVGGNRLPYTPRFNGNMGTELSWSPCTAITLYGRAEVTVYGDFEYDASNAQQQTTYSVADFRAGARGAHWFLEGWVNNAFDTHYVPIAIPYGSLASSGYIAEPGAPLTFGLRAGLTF
jgi:iron complex outermembrane receptor protein